MAPAFSSPFTLDNEFSARKRVIVFVSIENETHSGREATISRKSREMQLSSEVDANKGRYPIWPTVSIFLESLRTSLSAASPQ